MEKNKMYFDTQKAKIFKDYYRPSSNLSLFFRSVMSVIISGESPVGKPEMYKRKYH